MTSVERVRSLCKEHKVAVATLERDLGFGNGYLNPKKITDVSLDRAVAIAKYLGIPIETIAGEDEKRPATDGDGPYPTNPERAAKQEAITRLLPRMTDQELEDLLSEVKARILGQ